MNRNRLGLIGLLISLFAILYPAILPCLQFGTAHGFIEDSDAENIAFFLGL